MWLEAWNVTAYDATAASIVGDSKTLVDEVSFVHLGTLSRVPLVRLVDPPDPGLLRLLRSIPRPQPLPTTLRYYSWNCQVPLINVQAGLPDRGQTLPYRGNPLVPRVPFLMFFSVLSRAGHGTLPWQWSATGAGMPVDRGSWFPLGKGHQTVRKRRSIVTPMWLCTRSSRKA